MARNFCGYVNFNDYKLDNVIEQMSEKLNIQNQYLINFQSYSNAELASLYSKRRSRPTKSSFMNKMNERYSIVCFSNFIRLNELGEKLELRDILNTSHEEIILKAYLKWGKEVVHHLLGDWAFALYDVESKEVFLARNPHADGTLFYYFDRKTIYFSSILTGLVNINGIPLEVDQTKFFLENMTVSGIPSRTFYKDIHFLNPGCFLVANSKGISEYQYWKPYNLPKSEFQTDSQYFEAFYHTYEIAIKERLKLNDQWCLALSGGLDSAATAGMLSPMYAEKGELLKSYCYIPTDSHFNRFNSKKKFGTEGEFAQLTSDFNSSIDLRLVTKSGSILDYYYQYYNDFGLPPHTANNWFVEALSESAVSDGFQTVITAQGGNETLSFFGIPSTRSFTQLKTDLNAGLDLKNHELLMSLAKSIAGSTRKALLNNGSFNKARFKEMVSEWTFLNDDFVKEINGYDLLAEHYYKRIETLSEGENKLVNRMGIGSHCRLGLWNLIGSRHDVVFIDPSRDKHLQELVLSFPNHIFNRKGEKKYLYKQTFKNLVSKEVMYNNRMGFSMSDLTEMYKKDYLKINKTLALQKQKPHLSHMINFDRLESYLETTLRSENQSESQVLDLIRKNGSIMFSLMCP